MARHNGPNDLTRMEKFEAKLNRFTGKKIPNLRLSRCPFISS